MCNFANCGEPHPPAAHIGDLFRGAGRALADEFGNHFGIAFGGLVWSAVPGEMQVVG